MARQYVVTEEEMASLIRSLEMNKLRQEADHVPSSPIHKPDIDHLHRTFHRIVVQWTQDMGYKGFRL